ncbi:hypothetical protein [Roseovarius sp. MBR-6]|jgi:hypothetical protein|uniref:hypothetical protein n=1 Tax=Roseovarius sp. MBR-6 TaxID=3156459 RepID=UPI00339781C8
MIAVTLTGDRGCAYVTPAHVAAVMRNETTKSTCILLATGHEVFVREGVEAVRALLEGFQHSGADGFAARLIDDARPDGIGSQPSTEYSS